MTLNVILVKMKVIIVLNVQLIDLDHLLVGVKMVILRMIKEIVIDSTILDTRENLINLLFNTMSDTTQRLSDPININNAKIDNIRQSS